MNSSQHRATRDWQSLDAQHYLHPFTDFDDIARKGSRIITRAEGVYIYDSERRKILDGIEVAPLRLGIPEYKVGDELVLFLTKESDLGLCAPVGLLQGVFRVARAGRKAEVRNELRNERLFESVTEEAFEGLAPEELPAALKGRQAISLDHFLKLCGSVKE